MKKCISPKSVDDVIRDLSAVKSCYPLDIKALLRFFSPKYYRSDNIMNNYLVSFDKYWLTIKYNRRRKVYSVIGFAPLDSIDSHSDYAVYFSSNHLDDCVHFMRSVLVVF